MNATLITTTLRYEQDVVSTRHRARHIAALLGFDNQEQIRIATAVSEIARNAYRYAGGGKVEFRVEEEPEKLFLITIEDNGPGIRDLKKILSGRYVSETGMGMGIIGAKKLMYPFQVETAEGKGTKVVLGKKLPHRAMRITAERIRQITDELAQGETENPLQELQVQNQDLLRTLSELESRQLELTRLNRELDETNRGVVALYAELNDKADYLQRASELKTRFLSNMSHEFRTPLNSILALTRILLDRLDGDLSSEQEKQINFIRRSAEQLSELVNDLLDLAKVEAGKITVRPADFDVTTLFGTLRGALRPLLVGTTVGLVFEEPEGIPPLHTDDGKVSQILRNFISNALKFTERGEVRVSARDIEGNQVVFSVADTGIGIAPEHQERIFEEFAQIENPLQRSVKGTGLGLPLSRRLAELLGGSVRLESTPGLGSTFFLTIPLRYSQRRVVPLSGGAAHLALIIDDDEVARYILKGLLAGMHLDIREATTAEEGLRRALAERPDVIFLDLRLPGMSGFEALDLLQAEPETSDIHVIINTSKILDQREIERLAKAKAILSKDNPSREAGVQRVRDALAVAGLQFAKEVQHA
ncbi:MAG TPA: ATP-binding protein [Terriglobales bacterium]